MDRKFLTAEYRKAYITNSLKREPDEPKSVREFRGQMTKRYAKAIAKVNREVAEINRQYVAQAVAEAAAKRRARFESAIYATSLIIGSIVAAIATVQIL